MPTKGFPNRGTVTQHEYVGNSRTHGKSHTFLPSEGHENSHTPQDESSLALPHSYEGLGIKERTSDNDILKEKKRIKDHRIEEVQKLVDDAVATKEIDPNFLGPDEADVDYLEKQTRKERKVLDPMLIEVECSDESNECQGGKGGSGWNLNLSELTNQDNKPSLPLRLIKSRMGGATSLPNGRGDLEQLKIESHLNPEVFRIPPTIIKLPFFQPADNLVAEDPPQQRVGVAAGRTPFDPGEEPRKLDQVRSKYSSHLAEPLEPNRVGFKTSPHLGELASQVRNKPFSHLRGETGARVKLSPRLDEEEKVRTEAPSHLGRFEGVRVKNSLIPTR